MKRKEGIFIAKNTEKNQKPCNVAARRKYDQQNYKSQTISFKLEEMEAINTYCKEYNIPKNTLIRMAVMQRIDKEFV